MITLETIRAKLLNPPIDCEHYDWALALHAEDIKALAAELDDQTIAAFKLADGPAKVWDNAQFTLDGVEIIEGVGVDRGEMRLLRRHKR